MAFTKKDFEAISSAKRRESERGDDRVPIVISASEYVLLTRAEKAERENRELRKTLARLSEIIAITLKPTGGT